MLKSVHQMRAQRNILVAVVGNTPAIITETLWALEQQRGIRIDEIRIITTTVGRDSIVRHLLGANGHFAEYCREHQVPSGRIAFSPQHIHVITDNAGTELQDIRNSDDNRAAADQVFGLIQEWTSRKDERLLCSVAGGRKTLGIYLTMSLMLCGRPDDSISHVLVSPDFETGVPDFYYPPPAERALPRWTGVDETGQATFQPIRSSEARLDLADIPFPRLREAFGGGLPLEQGLTRAIEHSRLLLSYLQIPPALTVQLRERTITIGAFNFPLSRQLLAVYLFFLKFFNGNTGVALDDLFAQRTHLSDLERLIDRLRLGETEAYTWDKLRDMEEFRDRIGPCISKVNRQIRTALGDNRLAAHFQIVTGGNYGVNVADFRIVENA